MKVTKAKGLNTDLACPLRDDDPAGHLSAPPAIETLAHSLEQLAPQCRERDQRRAMRAVGNERAAASSHLCRVSGPPGRQPEALRPDVFFGPFALVTFIWARK
jgi:hypothetical protein